MQGNKIIIPFWIIYVNGGIGLLFGIITLIFGLLRGKTRLGVIGLIANTIAGFIMSLVGAIITTIIFIYLIRRKPVA